MNNVDFDEKEKYTVLDVHDQVWLESQYSFESEPRLSWGLLLVVSGEIRFEIENWSLVATRGDLVLLPCNSRYLATMKQGAERTRDYLINFSTPCRVTVEPKPTLICSNAPLAVFELMKRIITGKQLGQSEFRTTSDFYALLDAICYGQMDENSIVDTAKRKIIETPDMQISEVARICGVCESGLRSAFKKKVGVSPARFRMNTKIAKAKDLLQTGCGIKEITQELGFYDEAYFCKAFKAETGVSPKQYKVGMRL